MHIEYSSQVLSYYWFLSESTIDITLLSTIYNILSCSSRLLLIHCLESQSFHKCQDSRL